MLDQRPAADFEQWLGPRECERPHALATARGEDHRLHGRGSAASFATTAGSTRSAMNSPSGQAGVPRAGPAGVLQGARDVREVARLAVAMPEPREDAAHLEVPLHADEVEPAQELLVVPPGGEAGRERAAAVFERPAGHPLLRPGDVAVAQQRDEVVCERPVHRVLEIEDARVVARAHHEVARVVVAVHEHLRLLERVADQGFHGADQHARLVTVQFELEVPGEQPVGKQAHLEAQQLLVVGRQVAGVAGAPRLDAHQRVDRVAIEGVGPAGLREFGQVHAGPRSVRSRNPRPASRASTLGACTPTPSSMAATRRYGSTSSLSGGASITTRVVPSASVTRK